MPLLPGKKNIGHNVTELEKSNPDRSKKQDVAIALHTAHVKPEKAESVNPNGGEVDNLEACY